MPVSTADRRIAAARLQRAATRLDRAARLAAAIATHVLFGGAGAGFAACARRAPRVDFRAAFDSDRRHWRAGWRVRF